MHSDKNHLWHLINTPSGDSEPETRGPGICFLLMCCCCDLRHASGASELGNPSSKGMALALRTPPPWHLQTFVNSPRVATLSLATTAISSRKPIPNAGLQYRMVPCTSALADFSTLFCRPQPGPGKLPFIYFFPNSCPFQGCVSV